MNLFEEVEQGESSKQMDVNYAAVADLAPSIHTVDEIIGKKIIADPLFSDESDTLEEKSPLKSDIEAVKSEENVEKLSFSDDDSDFQPRNSTRRTSKETDSNVSEDAAIVTTEKPIFSDDEEESVEDVIKSPKNEKPIFPDDDSSVGGEMELNKEPINDELENPTESAILKEKKRVKSKKTKLHKNKEKKHRKSKAPELEKPDPVNLVLKSEIEIVKQLESGPTEAEIRRRQLIEVDPDILEDKIERLNQITISALENKFSSVEQKRQIRATAESLAVHLRDSVYTEFVESSLEKQMNKVFSAFEDVSFPFNPLEFIKKGDFSEDEKGDDKPTEEKLIDLSDSDVSDGEDIQVNIKISEPKMPTKEEIELEERKRRFLQAQARPQSSRTALLTALRQKVQETANENYCTQMRMQRDQLQTRLQIAENCRKLVELLKAKHEHRKASEREERRKMFQMTANSNEDEFDDGDDIEDGKFLTEEEKQAILAQFQDEDSASSEEEADIDAEEDAAEEADAMSVVQEELEGAREAILDSKINANKLAALMSESTHSANIDPSGDVVPENIQTADNSAPFHRDEEPTQIDEVAFDPVSMAVRDDSPSSDAHVEENDIVVRYGRPSRLTQVDDDLPEYGEESSSHQQKEKERATPPKLKKSGNAMFRLQLEQEEQLAKRSKVTVIISLCSWNMLFHFDSKFLIIIISGES